FDVLHGDAQFVGDDLREGGFFALTMWRRADHRLHLARRRDAHDGAFPQAALKAYRARYLTRTQTADFRVGGHADSQIAPLLACLCLLLTEIAVADHVERFFQRGFVIAAVVGQADGDLMPILERRDQVLAAQFHRVHVQFVRQFVHQPFYEEGCLRATRATIGIGWRGIGENAYRFAADI